MDKKKKTRRNAKDSRQQAASRGLHSDRVPYCSFPVAPDDWESVNQINPLLRSLSLRCTKPSRTFCPIHNVLAPALSRFPLSLSLRLKASSIQKFVPSWLARWAAAEGLLLWRLRKEDRSSTTACDLILKQKECWALGDIANW